MTFDIGNDVSVDDDAIIDQKIAEMDEVFQFVLLTDFFDESLILMKAKLCWDWDDVVYVKFKMRTEEAKATVSISKSLRVKTLRPQDLPLGKNVSSRNIDTRKKRTKRDVIIREYKFPTWKTS